MRHEFFGALSGVLVAISAIPYLLRVYQGKISPQLSSWALWTLIGFAVLLTYETTSVGWSVLPAVFGFVNPAAVTLLLLWKSNRDRRTTQSERGDLWRAFKARVREFTAFEWGCLAFGIIALTLWCFVKDDREHAPLALYTAIAADVCAVIPTLLFVLKHGDEERPFAWVLFSVGYAFALPAVSIPSLGNYLLPLYMTFGTMAISIPLVLYRIRVRSPLREWI